MRKVLLAVATVWLGVSIGFAAAVVSMLVEDPTAPVGDDDMAAWVDNQIVPNFVPEGLA